VLAAFQIGGRDAAIDSGAKRRRYNTYFPYIAITDQADRVTTVMAISVVGLWAVAALLAAGVLGVYVLTATATVHGPTSASAARAILKRFGQKKYNMGSPRINHLTPHACTFYKSHRLLTSADAYYSFLLVFFSYLFFLVLFDFFLFYLVIFSSFAHVFCVVYCQWSSSIRLLRQNYL
jgi:hypothetical protein